MIKTVFHYLNNDETLNSLLGQDVSSGKIKLFNGRPQATNNSQLNDNGSFIDFPYIVYNVVPIGNSNLTQDYRLQLFIVSDDDIQLANVMDRLNDLLDFRLYNVKRPSHRVNGDILLHSILQNAGNQTYYEKEKVFEQNLNFIIKRKK